MPIWGIKADKPAVDKFNLSEVLYQYTKMYRKGVSREDIQVLLESSPVFPSMLCLCLSLRAVGIPCDVFHAESNEILKLQRPFLAHVRGGVLLVRGISGGTVKYYNAELAWDLKIDLNRFLEVWDGIILYSSLGEARSLTGRWAWVPASLALITPVAYCNHWIITLLNLLGVWISLTLFKAENDHSRSLWNGVCKIGHWADCKSVMRSKFAQYGGLSMADLGLAFYSTAFFLSVFYIVIPSHVLFGNTYTALLTMGMPFVLYSLLAQVAIRKWCLLCLLLCILVPLQLGFVYVQGDGDVIPGSMRPFVVSALLELLALAIVLLHKKNSSYRHKYQAERIRRLRFLRVPAVLKVMLNEDVLPHTDFGLSIGGSKGSLTVSTWISPHCPHCARLVREMSSLIRNRRINWEIYFGGSVLKTVEKEWGDVPTALTAVYLYDRKLFLKVLKRWYSSGKFPKFQLHDVETYKYDSQKLLTEHYAFAERMRIRSFPAIYVNGRRLPKGYTIADLAYVTEDEEWINALADNLIQTNASLL